MASMERFTQRARRVLSLAHQEAERARQSNIGTEHLLLGLMDEEGGVAGRVLRELGMTSSRVREIIERVTSADPAFEPSKIELARHHFVEGGVSDLIEIREGDALVTLARDLPPTVDLVLLDGAKALYGDVLKLVEKHLRPGALVVADNTDYCPEYLAHVRSPGNGYVSVPFADDIEVSMRLG